MRKSLKRSLLAKAKRKVKQKKRVDKRSLDQIEIAGRELGYKFGKAKP